MVLVDSSVWIEAGRRDGDLAYKVGLESLLEVNEAAWCGPVKLEVLGAARPNARKALEYFFEVVPWLSVKDSTWERAKVLNWHLHSRGIEAPWNDILIGALSLENGCRAYAKDKHFDAMAREVGLMLYVPGYGGSYNEVAE